MRLIDSNMPSFQVTFWELKLLLITFKGNSLVTMHLSEQNLLSDTANLKSLHSIFSDSNLLTRGG